MLRPADSDADMFAISIYNRSFIRACLVTTRQRHRRRRAEIRFEPVAVTGQRPTHSQACGWPFDWWVVVGLCRAIRLFHAPRAEPPHRGVPDKIPSGAK